MERTRRAIELDLRANPPRLADCEHAAIARDLHRRACLGDDIPDPWLVATALGYTVLRSTLVVGCGHVDVARDLVLIGRGYPAPYEGLAIVHEVAHQEVVRSGASVSHGDVWLVTLCLALPGDRIARARAARDLPWPRWVLSLRTGIPAAAGLAA